MVIKPPPRSTAQAVFDATTKIVLGVVLMATLAGLCSMGPADAARQLRTNAAAMSEILKLAPGRF